MKKRTRIALKPKGNYFTSEKTNIKFVSSGCTLLNQALGGGYPLGRIVNVVGDKSTAKTALATEALVNFKRQYPKGVAAYRDSEAAFDEMYAKQMGMPDDVDLGDKRLATVEEFYADLDDFVSQTKGRPGLYVLDSLDALSDTAEMERDFGDSSYGAQKAKKLSELFRKLNGRVEASGTLLMVVSQVRDNIGAMFGEKHKRSGGRALDFYASQILYLTHLGILDRTINGVKRSYGIQVRAAVKKNKAGLPARKIDFEFWFGYGIEDLVSAVNWLAEVKRLKDINLDAKEVKGYIKAVGDMSAADYQKELDLVLPAAKQAWVEIDTSFMPKRSKYG